MLFATDWPPPFLSASPNNQVTGYWKQKIMAWDPEKETPVLVLTL
jgi:hypothetical protein